MRIILLLIWPLYLNDFYLIAIDNSNLILLWGLDVIFFTGIPTITLIYLLKTKQITYQEIGIGERPRIIVLMSGIVLCLLLVILIRWSLEPRLVSMMPWKWFQGYDFLDPPFRLVTIIYAAITAGVLEEIVYRGVIISQLQKKTKSILIVIMLSCIIFAGAHWSEGPSKLITTFVWAIPLVIWYIKRRNLWGPVICHTLYDFLVFTKLV